jgi:hypothetical protein
MSDDVDVWLDASAALLGIPVAPEWRDAVRQHLHITRNIAQLVLEFRLPDEADPAPIFRA